MISRLIEKIRQTKAPVVVGLDPNLSFIPSRLLEEAGGARLLRDEELTPETLGSLVKELLASPDALRAMGQAQHSLDRPDALDVIVDEMLRLSRKDGA